MGDMADWILDQCASMDDEPLFDYGGTLSCRYCGKNDLHWGNLGTRRKPEWRLYDTNGKLHSCKEYRPAGTTKDEE